MSGRADSVVTAILAAAMAALHPAVAQAADGPASIGFTRVHVPGDRISELPLGEGRYLPMPAAEFESAVSRLTGSGTGLPLPLAAAATYQARMGERGDLQGTVSFDVALPALPSVSMPLGAIDAHGGTSRLGDGVGEAVLLGLQDGSVAVRTPGPGTYRCDFSCRSDPGGELRLPLLPSLSTTVLLELPEEARPVVVGASPALIAAPSVATKEGRVDWRIEVGAGTDAAIRIVPLVQEPPRLTLWTEITVRGRQAEVTTVVQPSLPWTAGTIRLATPAALRITSVRITGQDPPPWRQEDGALSIELPEGLAGSDRSILVGGVAPIALDEAAVLPGPWPAAARWGGGGISLVIEPALVVEAMSLVEVCAVTPAAAARWPLPSRLVPSTDRTRAADADGARLFFEQQSGRGSVTVTLRPRTPRLETARVTTVELSPGTVVGRAACDVRVVAGAAFTISADVMPGWLIDSVEVGEWDARGGGFVPSTTDRSLDWRLVQAAGGGELRIGLGLAATPNRRLGLRIAGHHDGVPLGTEFMAGDMDMVRLPGESPDAVVVDFRVASQADVEIDGERIDLVPVTAGLSPLVEPGLPRGRMPGGARAARGKARLVERRSPLDARVEVGLAERDGRLSETFTLECLPDAGVLDAVVVDFSEPMGDALEWSLLQPAAGAIGARRLEAAERTHGDASPQDGIAESWLVELRPAASGPIRIQAARTVPFDEAVPVPLAWVQGATAVRGTVSLHAGAVARPTLLNRRLRELPPAAAPVLDAAAMIVELAYGSPAEMVAGGEPAADVLPGTGESHAWAWRESITCWCHDSGRTEWEMIFDLENHGRESLTLALPRGLAVEGVSIDGAALPVDGVGPAGGEIRLALPPGLPRTRVAVHGSTAADARPGVWRVTGVGCAVDVPVLDRQMLVMLPTELELASPVEAASGSSGDWARRLFNAEPRFNAGPRSDAGPRRGIRAAEPTAVGFRGLAVDPARAATTSGFIVVRRRLIASLAILTCLAATAGGLMLAGRRGTSVVGACAVAAIGALWVPPPFDVVVRSAWWGLLGAVVTTAWRGFGGRRTGAGLAALILVAATNVAADEPVRVFITPGADGTAFVPEPMFRLLSERQAEVGAAVRVASCRVVAGTPTANGAWRMVLDVQADQAGALVIDQSSCGAAWMPAKDVAGVVVHLEKLATVARLVVGPGRHRVELAVRPGLEQRGEVQEASVCLPPAPAAELEVADVVATGAQAAPADGGWQCESAVTDGEWRRAPVREGAAVPAYDVSRATRLRLLRPVDPQDVLVDTIEDATSSNEVAWLSDSCRVAAAFEVGAGREIVRSLVVRAAAGLQPVATRDAVVRPLGASRFAVELPEPRAGRRRVKISFAMPLADAVGVFDVPGVWLESVANDERTVRLVAAGDLDVTAEPPGGAALVRPRDGDAPGLVAQWRLDVASAADARTGTIGRQRASVTVRRRLQSARIAQRLAVEFASDHVGLRLQCQCDTGAAPLLEVPLDVSPAAVIDRVSVWDESQGQSGQPAAEAVDVAVSRPAPGRVVVVMQQPRAGRFRLEADLRLPFPPANHGRFPLARVTNAAGTPLAVTWQAAPDRVLRVAEPGGMEASVGDARTLLELSATDNPPEYVLQRRAALPVAAESPAAEPPRGADERVDEVVLASIHLAIDGRGRAWGLARFDVTTSEPRLRLRLPPGLRLFDLLVDGREAHAVPDGDTWSLRLHDVLWPRSVLAVMAGDVGGTQADAAPVRLEPPRLEGLSCRSVLWTIDAPSHLALRLAPPAQLLDAQAWDQTTSAARARCGALFAGVAVEGDGGRRLREFAALRSAGGVPELEREWQRNFDAPPAGGTSNRVHAIVPGDGSLTLRAVRRADRGFGSRGLVTLILMTVAAAVWGVAGRLPAGWGGRGSRLVPWSLVAAGFAWLLVLTPALPGCLLVAAGAAALVAEWQRILPTKASPAFDSTRTFLVG